MRGGPKVRCDGKWSEARFSNFIKSALRAASSRWAPKYSCLKQAKVAYGKYKCAQCGKIFGPTSMKVDHVQPVVDPIKGFQGWDEYVGRLFIEVDGFQALCVTCHNAKSILENELRRQSKKLS